MSRILALALALGMSLPAGAGTQETDAGRTDGGQRTRAVIRIWQVAVDRGRRLP